MTDAALTMTDAARTDTSGATRRACVVADRGCVSRRGVRQQLLRALAEQRRVPGDVEKDCAGAPDRRTAPHSAAEYPVAEWRLLGFCRSPPPANRAHVDRG